MAIRCLTGMNSIYLFVLLLLTGWACKDKPRHRPDDYAAMPLYCDYRISGDDESGHITVLMQFRAGGPDGPGMLLESPASVELDGYRLEADSSRMHGVYYEQRWLADEFDGPHQIQYVNKEGDTLFEKFHFPIFGFRNDFPEKWQVKDQEIEITGLSGNDSLHLLLLDTAYLSRGIDRYILLEDNKIKLSAADLGRLKKGPVIFEVYRDMERALRQEGEGGGKLSVSFALRRRFLLQ